MNARGPGSRRAGAPVALAALAALGVAGCGARSELIPPTSACDGACGEPARDASPPPRVGCLADLPARPTDPRAPGRACEFASPDATDAAVFAALAGTRLVFVTERGEVRAAYEFGRDPALVAGRTPVVRRVASRGEYVLAAVVFAPARLTQGQADLELALLRRDGRVLLEQRFEVPYQNSGNDLQIVGNSDGVFAYGYLFGPHGATRVVSAAGRQLAEVTDGRPLTDPDASGRLALSTWDNATTSWYDPCDGARRPTRETSRPRRDRALALADRLVYPDGERGTLVSEGADDALEVAIGAEHGRVELVDVHPSGWALLATQDPQVFLSADVRTGALRTLRVVVPAGLTRFRTDVPGFDPSVLELRVRSTGGLLLGLRTPALGRMYFSEDGARWEPAGSAVGESISLHGIERGGTTLFSAQDLGARPSDWSPAPAGSERIDGRSVQLVRAGGGSSRVLRRAAPGTSFLTLGYRLSADGGCASSWTGTTLEVFNAVTGTTRTFELGAPSDLAVPALSTWVGGEDARLPGS